MVPGAGGAPNTLPHNDLSAITWRVLHRRASVFRKTVGRNAAAGKGRETGRARDPAPGPCARPVGRRSDLGDVGGLQPLRPLAHLEFDVVVLLQRLEAVGLNRGVVDEHIGTTLTLDETEPLRVV